MKIRLLTVVAVLGPLALAACGAPTTEAFVRKAALSELYEIEAGKIAAAKGQSEAVKQFGQHMVEAHGKTREELRSIVETEKIGVKLPDKLDKWHRKMIEALNQATPEEFDKTYAAQQVRAHKKAAALFDDYAEDGDNESLKRFAANTLTVVKQHLDEAKSLAQ
jgi:putative membrane protein